MTWWQWTLVGLGVWFLLAILAAAGFSFLVRNRPLPPEYPEWFTDARKHGQL